MPWAPRVVRTGRPSASSTASTATPRRTRGAGVGRQHLQGRIERRTIEAHRRRAAILRPVRQADGRPTRRLEAHRRDRARHAGDHGLGDAQPTQRLDRDRRAEHPTGTPPPRRLSLQDGDVDAGARERGGKRASSQPATDDRDVDQRRPRIRGRGHAGAPAGGPSTGATVAASATRYPIGPPTMDDSTRRPAAVIRDVSSATVYARRTDSGASRRV